MVDVVGFEPTYPCVSDRRLKRTQLHVEKLIFSQGVKERAHLGELEIKFPGWES